MEGDANAPVGCPAGTYNNRTHGLDISSCTRCIAGHYCEGNGLVYPTGKCAAGFFCTSGSKVANPAVKTMDYGPCPTGHYCPVGTGVPNRCPMGTYNSLVQQEECTPCPDGHFCHEAASNYTQCLLGHYCPNG